MGELLWAACVDGGVVVSVIIGRLGGEVVRETVFFFNDTATTEIYTLSLHDALPICRKPQYYKMMPKKHERKNPN